jgi:ribosomal protein L11 methyltransferase
MAFEDKFIKYYFKSDWDINMMIAFLSSLPFDSFEEQKNGVVAYLPEEKNTDDVQKEILDVCTRYQIEFEKDIVRNKNWNEEWESSFEPVEVGDFCIIKATFHEGIDISGYKYSIDITPQMTFGTGHHETTYTMIELLSEINVENKKILDFGAGTGILSILAEKMGASEIIAIDNDPVAVENIVTNTIANTCKKITSEFGEHADLGKFEFDLIFANINKNILIQEAENLSMSLRKGGFLLLSGILKDDFDDIKILYERNSMKLMKTLHKGKWLAMKFVAY